MPRGRRRKKKKSGIFAILFLPTVLLIMILLYKYVFVVKNVEIIGTTDLPDDVIARAADLDYGNSIFFVNMEKSHRGIDGLGSVYMVNMERKMPSTIVIEVSQRKSSSVVVFQNSIIEIDEYGYVIGETESIPKGSVFVNGMHIMSCKKGAKISAGNGQVEAMCETVAAIHMENGTQYVTELNLEEVNNITIKAINETIVTVGTTENIRQKMAWMTAVVSDLVKRGQEGGKLDVSSGTKADYSAPVVEETEQVK